MKSDEPQSTEAASSNGKTSDFDSDNPGPTPGAATPYVHWTRPRGATRRQDDATYGIAYARDPEKWLKIKRAKNRRRAATYDLDWEREKARFTKGRGEYPAYV